MRDVTDVEICEICVRHGSLGKKCIIFDSKYSWKDITDSRDAIAHKNNSLDQD